MGNAYISFVQQYINVVEQELFIISDDDYDDDDGVDDTAITIV